MSCWFRYYLCGQDLNGEDEYLEEEINGTYVTSEGSLTKRREIHHNAAIESKEGFPHKHEGENMAQVKILQVVQVVGNEIQPSSSSTESEEVEISLDRIFVVAGARVPSSPMSESVHFADMENFARMATLEEVHLHESARKSEGVLQADKMIAVCEEKALVSPRVGEGHDFQKMKRIVVSYAQTATFHEENKEMSLDDEDFLESMGMSEESFQIEKSMGMSFASNSIDATHPTLVLSEIAVSRQYISDSDVCFGVSPHLIPNSGDNHDGIMRMEQMSFHLTPGAEERPLGISTMRSVSIGRSLSIGRYDDLSIQPGWPENYSRAQGEPSPSKLTCEARTFKIGTLGINDKKDFDQKLAMLFRKYDADYNTYIDRNEMKILYESELGLDLKEDEWKRLFKKIDKNRDGQISLKEFLKASMKYVTGANLEYSEEEFLRKQFRLFAKKGKIGEKDAIRWLAKATGKTSWACREHFYDRVAKYGKKSELTEKQFLTYYGAMKFAAPARFDNELKSMREWDGKEFPKSLSRILNCPRKYVGSRLPNKSTDSQYGRKRRKATRKQ